MKKSTVLLCALLFCLALFLWGKKNLKKQQKRREQTDLVLVLEWNLLTIILPC